MRAYRPSDLPTLNRWYAAHGRPAPSADLLPRTGYLVEDTAAGFLFRTDAPALALLEGFVTSPAAPLRKRRAALAAIVEQLVLEAKACGARRVIGFTKSRGMTRLVEEAGFVPGDLFVLVAKEV